MWLCNWFSYLFTQLWKQKARIETAYDIYPSGYAHGLLFALFWCGLLAVHTPICSRSTWIYKLPFAVKTQLRVYATMYFIISSGWWSASDVCQNHTSTTKLLLSKAVNTIDISHRPFLICWSLCGRHICDSHDNLNRQKAVYPTRQAVALVKVMAWCRICDKPLVHSLKVDPDSKCPNHGNERLGLFCILGDCE